jgi:hypothetical protein
MASLTAAINILPNMYGRMNQLGLMPDKGVTTRTIMVEEQNGVLTLLATKPLGSPGSVGNMGKRKLRSFVIPHIPHEDLVMPDEVQGIRTFGSETETAVLTGRVNDKLQAMRNKHAITLEHLRMGALKGIILDADGSTIYNLFTEFEITQKTVSFALTTATTKVISKCLEVLRHIEDNLLGEVMTGVHCLCSPEFYDALTTHAMVEAAFSQYQIAAQMLGGDNRKGFVFGNILFEEYRGTASDSAGTARKFIAANEAIVFPLGTMQTFATYFAPADFNETANTNGLPYYAKIDERKFGRGYDLHTQSNPLPMCQRPGLLVRLTKT